MKGKAKAIWSRHGFYYTYPEGGDGWGALGPNTRLFNDAPEYGSAHKKAEELAATLTEHPRTVEVVAISVTLEPWAPN